MTSDPVKPFGVKIRTFERMKGVVQNNRIYSERYNEIRPKQKDWPIQRSIKPSTFYEAV